MSEPIEVGESHTPEALTPAPRPLARRQNLAACAALFVLAFVFMLPGLWPGRVAVPADQLMAFDPWQTAYPNVHPLLPGSDPIQNQIPWHQWAANELGAGRFPLWVSAPLGGYNLFASYQAGVLFPLHLLWALLPTAMGLGIIMALKVWLAGMGTWFFLRALGLRPSASFIGALAFMFSGSLVAWLPWTIASIYMLLPWLAWAAYGWSVSKSRWALVGLATLIACAIFGGHPESMIIVLATGALWAFSLLVTGPRRDWLRQIAGFVVAAGIGLAIGAVQILPFWEALGLSHLSSVREVGSVGMSVFHLDAGSMLLWILPRTWGQLADGVLGGSKDNIIEAMSYVGLVPLLGTILAVVAAVRRQLSLRFFIPWAIFAVLGWLLVYDVVVGGILRNLPILNRSVNTRWLLLVEFSVIVMGAFGFDWLARRMEARAASKGWRSLGVRGLVGVCLLALGVIVLAAHLAGLIPYPYPGGQPRVLTSPTDAYDYYWAIWAAGIALGIAGAVLIWTSGWTGRRVMPLALGALLVADLWMLFITFNQSASAEYYYPTTNFIRQLSVVPPTERILVQGQGMPPDTSLMYNIRDWRAQDPMIPQRAYKASRFIDPDYASSIWTEYNMFMNGPRFYVANALGIRYFIMPRGFNPNDPSFKEPGSPDFKRLAYTNGLGLWGAQGVPGYAYLSDNVQSVPDEAAASRWMNDLDWDKMRDYAAMVEAPPDVLAGIEHKAGSGEAGSATVKEYTPGHIVLDVDAARPSVLVVAESYYPGWRATIDGHPVDILRANYLSQGLVMSPGKHVAEFKYDPGSFRYGALISLAGLAGLVALAAWAGLRRNQRSDSSV